MYKKRFSCWLYFGPKILRFFFEIHSLFVSPNFRESIAKTLLSNLIENCKNDRINKILLEFVEFNEAAKFIFEK